MPRRRSDFSLADGHCFKSLIVGKSNTLNYYQAVNGTSEIQVRLGGGGFVLGGCVIGRVTVWVTGWRGWLPFNPGLCAA